MYKEEISAQGMPTIAEKMPLAGGISSGMRFLAWTSLQLLQPAQSGLHLKRCVNVLVIEQLDDCWLGTNCSKSRPILILEVRDRSDRARLPTAPDKSTDWLAKIRTRPKTLIRLPGKMQPFQQELP